MHCMPIRSSHSQTLVAHCLLINVHPCVLQSQADLTHEVPHILDLEAHCGRVSTQILTFTILSALHALYLAQLVHLSHGISPVSAIMYCTQDFPVNRMYMLVPCQIC